MNKYQEAFNELIEDYNDLIQQKSDLSDYYEWYGTQEKIDIIQELVDKETPMKSKLMNCGKCGDFHIKGIKKIVAGEGRVVAHPFNYCGNCGQRVDWSEE